MVTLNADNAIKNVMSIFWLCSPCFLSYYVHHAESVLWTAEGMITGATPTLNGPVVAVNRYVYPHGEEWSHDFKRRVQAPLSEGGSRIFYFNPFSPTP